MTGVTGPHEEELEDAGLLTTQRINYLTFKGENHGRRSVKPRV